MQIDISGLKNVKPNLDKAKKAVKSAKGIVSGISAPGDFEGAGTLKQVPQFLSQIEERLGNLSSWVDTTVNKFQEVQSRNKSIIGGLSDNIIFKLYATQGNVIMSAAKGAGSLVEHLLDAGAITLTGAGTVATGASDVTRWIVNKAKGKDTKLNWNNTKKIWKNTMSFVSNDYVGSAFNKFYDSKVGKFIDKAAYKPFRHNGAVSSAVSGVTEVAGIALITAITGGIAGIGMGTSASAAAAAGVAGSAGVGKYTGKAWNTLSKKDGKDNVTLKKVAKSLGNGVLNGAWEGAQWFLGAKLGNIAIKGSKLGSAALRVGIDSSVNAVDTPFRAVTNSLLTGDKFKESWKKEGGWTSLLTNFGIGLLGSTFGEVKNWSKTPKTEIDLKNIKKGKNVRESQKTMNNFFKENPEFKVNQDKINNAFKNIRTCKTEEEFTKIAINKYGYTPKEISTVSAFYSSRDNLVWLRPSNDAQTVSHEVNHSLGNILYGKNARGINEAVTEKLALKAHGISGSGDSGYKSNVQHLLDLDKVLNKAGVYNADAISYYNTREKYYYENVLNELAESPKFYDYLKEAMDVADGWGPVRDKESVKKANMQVEQLIQYLYEGLRDKGKIK